MQKTLLCASLSGPSLSQVRFQIAGALSHADLFELRLDLIDKKIEPKDIAHFITLRPWILTTAPDIDLEPWLKLKPTYVQVEVDDLPDQITLLSRHRALNKLIISRHSASKDSLKKILPAKHCKIAFPCTSTLEAMDFLIDRGDEIGIPMGECGAFSRALSQKLQMPIAFAATSQSSAAAPGQLTLNELTSIYRIKEQTPSTEVYALVGNPVSKSIGHIFHNKAFKDKKIDACYVKLPIESGNLSECIEKGAKLGFIGYSVTTPLKEEAASIAMHSDPCVLASGAANTLVLSSGAIYAANTDGPAAVSLLEEHMDLFGVRVAILGAGATARAIGYSLMQKGASVTFFNRTLKHAEKAAESLHARASTLKEFCPYGFEIVVQATSARDLMAAKEFPKECIYLEVLQEKTLMQALAQTSNCLVINGCSLFYAQAALQQDFWDVHRSKTGYSTKDLEVASI